MRVGVAVGVKVALGVRVGVAVIRAIGKGTIPERRRTTTPQPSITKIRTIRRAFILHQ